MFECAMRVCLFLFLVVCSLSGWSGQSPTQLSNVLEQFLLEKTQGLPGQAVISIGPIEQSNRFPPCVAPEISLAPGSRAWGHTKLVVRCLTPTSWQQYVSARVSLMGRFPVAARPLPQGQTISEADLTTKDGDLTDFSPNIITTSQQAYGKVLLMPVAPGQPLRSDLLKQPVVLQQGQNVKVVTQGPGFQVSSDGQALTSATEGQVVRVRMPSGQTVSGIAKYGGIVEIGH